MTREISRQAFIRGRSALLPQARWVRAGRPRQNRRRSRRLRPARLEHPPQYDRGSSDPAVQLRIRRGESLFNSRFDSSTAAAVVWVKSRSDVQRAVEFAARNSIKIAARSGGHSYIGVGG
jgi:hypothetical protein